MKYSVYGDSFAVISVVFLSTIFLLANYSLICLHLARSLSLCLSLGVRVFLLCRQSLLLSFASQQPNKRHTV